MRTKHFNSQGSLTRIAIGILIVAVGLFIYKKWVSPQEIVAQKSLHYVTLSSDGFYPSRITIRKGDTIRFATILEKPFWPASDSHPAHTNYPEFDPQRPLEPRETFEFVFEKEGRWGYHNHLAPSQVGTVVVRGVDEPFSREASCAEDDMTGECGREKLKAFVVEKGIEAGFALFLQPDIIANQSNCHQLAHELGKLAYEQSAVERDAPLTEETAFCEFGFWHGFMDALTREAKGKDIENAQKICLRVAEKDAQLGEENQWSCWHGLGLASVGDPPDLAVWGDARRMAENAIPFCEKVGTTDAQRAMCAEGAFHSEITYMLNQQYGLSFDLAHPLAFCDAQEKYRNGCYIQLAPRISRVLFSLLTKNHSLLIHLDPQVRSEFVNGVALGWIRNHREEGNFAEDFIESCYAMPKEDWGACIKGGARGLLNKDDSLGYKPALAFCAMKELAEKERADCYSFFGSLRRSPDTPGKLSEICSTVPSRYAPYCLGDAQAR